MIGASGLLYGALMTDQELFDYVVGFTKRQGGPSANDECLNLYRGPNGTMCAAGCLIKDEYYRDSLEGDLVSSKGVTDVSR